MSAGTLILRGVETPTEVPSIPAEQLERIETGPKMLTVPLTERRPQELKRGRNTVIASRAWSLGGGVD